MCFAQWKIPVNRFKICHIFGIKNPNFFIFIFSFFILSYFRFVIVGCRGPLSFVTNLKHTEVAQNGKRKIYLGYHIPNVWQILKYFVGIFHQANPTELLGVYRQDIYWHLYLLHLYMKNAASSSFGQEIGKLEIMEGHFLHTGSFVSCNNQ